MNVDGNAPAPNGDVGPDPRDSPTGSPEDGAGEDEEGLVGPGEVPGSTGNRRKRNRKSRTERNRRTDEIKPSNTGRGGGGGGRGETEHGVTLVGFVSTSRDTPVRHATR